MTGGLGARLNIYNQDRSVRMQLNLTTLVYEEQFTHPPGVDANVAQVPARTIRDFVIIFIRTLRGRHPSRVELRNTLRSLSHKSKSALFYGYGWKLTIGDQIYQKN